MDIRNTKQLTGFAAQRVEQTREQKKLVLIYAGCLTALSALVVLIQFLLDIQIGKTGGLGSMGLRSILSAIKPVLTVVKFALSLCLSIGYLSAMLRIARGQFVSTKTLRLGFDRFWVLLRKTLLEGLIYFGAATIAMYASTFLYVLTPLSRGFMDVLTPMLSENSALNPYALLSDEAVYSQLVSAMTPFFILFLVLFCLVAIPLAYRYRMANYVLIDHPEKGAFAVLRESRMMMRGNCVNLFRLDLRMWWYYAAVTAISVIGFGDLLLPLVGVSFPWSDTVGFYLFFALSQLLQFGLCVTLRNRVETAYALAYDAIRPQEPQNGAVLGNIFQM